MNSYNPKGKQMKKNIPLLLLVLSVSLVMQTSCYLDDLSIHANPQEPGPVLYLKYPSGGGIFNVGDTIEVTWTSSKPAGPLKLRLFEKSTIIDSILNIPDLGYYKYYIPVHIVPSPNCYLTIESQEFKDVRASTGISFRISPNFSGTWVHNNFNQTGLQISLNTVFKNDTLSGSGTLRFNSPAGTGYASYEEPVTIGAYSIRYPLVFFTLYSPTRKFNFEGKYNKVWNRISGRLFEIVDSVYGVLTGHCDLIKQD